MHWSPWGLANQLEFVMSKRTNYLADGGALVTVALAVLNGGEALQHAVRSIINQSGLIGNCFCWMMVPQTKPSIVCLSLPILALLSSVTAKI